MKPTRFDNLSPFRLRLLAGFALLVSLISVSMYWWRLDVANRQIEQDAADQIALRSEELVGAVAGQTEATLRMVDFTLRHLRDEYVEGGDIDRNLRSLYNHFPTNAIAQIGVIDPKGYLTWSSVGVNGHIYLGDREHFKAHLNTKEDKLFISHPVLGRATGAWSIQFSRPIWRKGQFLGVMVLSMSPQYFADAYKDMLLRETDVVSLFRLDGAYLSRTPSVIEAMGKVLPGNRPFLAPEAPERGVFRTKGQFDKVDRTYAWRKLHSYPVIINIGIDDADLLLPVTLEVNQSRKWAAWGSLMVLLLTGIVCALLFRAARQQQSLLISEKRYRSFFEKNTSIKMVIDPDNGHIVDANPAAVSYYGYPLEKLLALNISDINCLPPDKLQAEMRSAKADQRNYFRFRHRLASGEERDVEVYSGTVEDGEKKLLLSIVHDVTSHYELEQRLEASEALQRSLISTMAEGIVVVNNKGVITTWNNSALDILGVSANDLQTRNFVLLTANGNKLDLSNYPSLRAAHGEVLDHELYGVVKTDGSCRWITVNSRLLRTDNMAATDAAVLSFSDITRLVEAEESLRLAQSVFEVAGEGILVTDDNNKIIAVNPAFTQLTGFSAEEAIGQTPSLLASGRHDADFYLSMWKRLVRDGHWEGEITNRRRDGQTYIEWLRITVVPERPGHSRRYIAIFSDITDRKREAEVVWRQANFDELTGLANRKLLEDRLKRAIAQANRKHATVAVLFIDLDKFKPVNDQYGHAAGDELLKQVSRRLEHCLRDEDTVARLGGDEFVVVLPDLHVSEVPTKAAEKIVAVLSEPFRIGDNFIEISCSIGISLFPRDTDNTESLIAKADAAMYAAKQAGRSTWQSA